jgi:glutamyl-tRNA synthetase
MAEAQLAALQALGLGWDEGPGIGGTFGPYVQSERGAVYAAALDRLQTAGRLYRCYCSRAELAREPGEPGEEGGPIYPGTCRDLSAAACEAKEAAGRAPAWRFRVRPGVMAFHDQVFGQVAQDVAREVGDFVVKRRDGVVAYQLAVVADDIAMQIDHVLRGADLLGSTGRQLQLYEALGAPAPAFAHVPIWVGADGAKLSKRHGKIGVHSRLAAGEAPGAILSEIAAALGLRSPVDRAEELLSGFEVGAFGRMSLVAGAPPTHYVLGRRGSAPDPVDGI